jgi:hypothetical protein
VSPVNDVDEVPALVAKTFIARRDVKAVQARNGAYRPVTDDGKPDGNRLPWTMGDLRSHVSGEATFGHYVVSAENTAKVFCFDLDLEKEIADESEPGGKRAPRWTADAPGYGEMERTGDARAMWRPTDLWQWCTVCRRGWYTDFQPPRCTDDAHQHEIGAGNNPDTLALTARLNETAFRLAARIKRELEIPVAVAYSGNKGLHVYGITGEHPASDVRMAANLILESFDGRYVPKRGSNFFRDTDPDFEPVSIEVFPKQDSLDGKDLGNLIRLPLGINRKSGNRAFFVRHGAYSHLSEMDPVAAMTVGNPWS